MKLLLHIGTHKTGSSSLQFFLATNRPNLQKEKIYYSIDENKSSKNVNFLGGNISKGKNDYVSNFTKQTKERAEKAGAATVVLSGETMYAMSFFYPAFGHYRNDKYWQEEKNRVDKIAELTKVFDVEVICYLRSQNSFAESIYSQLIRDPAPFSIGFEEFLNQAEELFDYNSHLQLWCDAFGKDNVNLNIFDKDTNIIKDFCNFMHISPTSNWYLPDVRIGDRTSYDLLAFKRKLDKKKKDPIQRQYDHWLLFELAELITGPENVSWFSEENKKRFSQRFFNGNELIREQWFPERKSLFDDVKNDSKQEYPGLSKDRFEFINREYKKLINKPDMLLKLQSRRLLYCLESNSKLVSKILAPVRRYIRNNRRKKWRKGETKRASILSVLFPWFSG